MIKGLQLTVVGLCLLFMGIEASAQIVIKKENYPLKYGPDTFALDATVSNIDMPEFGENMVWDYSGLGRDGLYINEIFDGTGETSFPGATHKDNTRYSIQGMEYDAVDFYKLDDNSYSNVGRRQKEATHSITAFTGGANDVLVVPDADLVFPKTRDYLRFPFTYGDAWEQVDIQLTNVELTVAAFGLNKTPVEIVRYRYQSRDVVGYGKLTIPDKDGNPSNSINALLVTVKDSVVDSIFMGGKPAPAPLLAAFKYTQGQTFNYTDYVFETMDLGRAVVVFNNVQGNTCDDISFRPRATRLAVGIQNATVSASVYPSILSAGSQVNFNIAGQKDIQSVKLIDLQGKEIELKRLNLNQYTVPAYLSSGLYMYQLNLKNENMPLTGKLRITE